MTGVTVKAVNGTCEIRLVDSKGQRSEVHLPIAVLERAAAEATRGRLSYQSRMAAGELESRGGMQEFPILDPTNYDVAYETMHDPPAVIIVVDRDTEAQLAYRFPIKHAAKLADRILKACEKLSGMLGGTKH